MTTEPKTESKKPQCRHDGEKTYRTFESKTAYGVQTNEYCVNCQEFIGCSFKEHRPTRDSNAGVQA